MVRTTVTGAHRQRAIKAASEAVSSGGVGLCRLATRPRHTRLSDRMSGLSRGSTACRLGVREPAPARRWASRRWQVRQLPRASVTITRRPDCEAGEPRRAVAPWWSHTGCLHELVGEQHSEGAGELDPGDGRRGAGCTVRPTPRPASLPSYVPRVGSSREAGGRVPLALRYASRLRHACQLRCIIRATMLGGRWAMLRRRWSSSSLQGAPRRFLRPTALCARLIRMLPLRGFGVLRAATRVTRHC